MSLEENEHASKMAAIQRDYEDRIAEIDRLERELREKQGGQLTEEQTQAFSDARSAAQSKKNTEEERANKDTLNSMLSDIMTYQQARQQVEEEYARRRKELYEEDGKTLKQGVTEGNVANLDTSRDEALQAVDEEFASKSVEYQEWMNTIADMTLKQLTKALETAQVELEALKGSDTASDEDIAVAQAKVNNLTNQIEKVEAKGGVKGRSIESWKELGDALKDTGAEFEALGNEIGGTSGEVIKSIGSITTTAVSMMNNITQVVEMCSKGIVSTSEGASTAVKAVETASVILAIISVAIQLITKIVSIANKMHDAKYDKIIEQNQSKIDSLKESYEDLEEAVSNTFGSDAVQKLQDMNASLEQQNKLIQQQKDAEQEKKKEDESTIQGYDDAMEDNRKQMEDNTRAMEEAIFGNDIKSAIESFAEAYGDAIAEGKNLNQSMKDHAVQMMKQMVQEEIKAYIAGQGKLEALREKMALYFKDGVFSNSEIETLKAEAEAIGRDLDEKFAWAEDLLAEEDSSSSGGSSKRGIATASQESVDENNGRLMSIQLSMSEIKEQVIYTVTYLANMSNSISSGNHILSDIREQSVRANGYLEDIVKYTKPLNEKISEVVTAINKLQI